MEALTADALAQLEDMVRRMRKDQGLAHSLDEIKVGKDIQQLVMAQFGELFAKHFPPGLVMELALALEKAERKHPVFAEGVYQGLGRLSEEMGELSQSVNHGEPQARIDAEAMDLLVVAWRFARRDWQMPKEEPMEEDAQ